MSHVTSSDGPVAVTGASGYIGTQVVAALLRRGYVVRACVSDATDADRTKPLLEMNRIGLPGRLELCSANLLIEASYDSAVAGCSAVLHCATPMAYSGNTPRQVHDGAISGTNNVLASVRRSGTVRRFVHTSSFAAIAHPVAPGYVFTEADWASDLPSAPSWWLDLERGTFPNWKDDDIDSCPGPVAYAIAKVTTEKLVFAAAEEDGRFDAISVCPSIGIGPLLSPLHGLGSWQLMLGRMLEGQPCSRGWRQLLNIVDVRDVGEAQARIIQSDVCGNGDRYQLTATDTSGELNVVELQEQLQELFPDYHVGGPPEEYAAFVADHGGPYDSPRAYCDKARRDLGLSTHAIADTLFETGKTLVELGVVEPALKKS
jgi:nucleoside-diphosphate-sugar epimerase